jgi:hypothetical protein
MKTKTPAKKKTTERRTAKAVGSSPLVRLRSLVHVWGGHGEGGLYIDGKKVSDYYNCGQAAIVEALGFTPEEKHLNEAWYADQVTLPDNLNDCEFA